MASAVIISARRVPGHITWLGRPFWLLSAASLLIAISDVGSKYALEYMSFWNVYWLGSLTMIAVFLGVSLRFGVVRQLLRLPQRRKTLSIVAGNEMMATLGIILVFFWRWSLGLSP